MEKEEEEICRGGGGGGGERVLARSKDAWCVLVDMSIFTYLNS